MGTMRILCSLGDETLSWDPDSDKSCDFAENKFNELIKKDHKAYRLGDDKKKRGWPIKEFPPHAAELIFIPPIVGG